MTAANDSSPAYQIAPEDSYGVPTPYIATITGGTPAGTFSITIDGQIAASLSATILASALQTALAALTTVGAGNVTCTGLITTGITITLTGYRAALPVSADFTGVTGGATSTLTGGPVWLTVKAKKWKGKDKTAVKFIEEMRNSPDPFYEDSQVIGGQVCDWSVEMGLRADQIGHFAALVGFTDSVSTSGGVTTHTMKPGAVGSRKSYSVRQYNGKDTRIAIGLVGISLDMDGKAGESGTYDVAFKGFSHRRVKLATNPSLSLPSNTTYRRIGPTNTGVSLSVGGSVNSLVQEWKWAWTWETKPFFTQTGVKTPYRAESGKRHLKSELKLLFDDNTEYQNALADVPATEALAFTLQGTEVISGGVFDTVNISVPANLYQDPDIEDGFNAPTAKLNGEAAYSTSSACATSLVIKNSTATAYS